MKSGKRDPSAGMSILEVMVALAVMALISLILASGLGTAARVFNRGSGFSANVDDALNRQQLRDWIERASTRAFPKMEYLGLSGTSDKMVVEVLPVDGFFWAGAPIIATVYTTPDHQIGVQAVGYATSEQSRTIDLSLSESEASLEISYYGSPEPETLPIWQNTWRASNGLPLLVKFTSSNSAVGFPPLVVYPGKTYLQREISLSSLLPPIRPSRP